MLFRTIAKVVDFLKREDGPTAVEYAVMLAVVVVVCLIAIAAMGTSTNDTMNNVSTVVDVP